MVKIFSIFLTLTLYFFINTAHALPNCEIKSNVVISDYKCFGSIEVTNYIYEGEFLNGKLEGNGKLSYPKSHEYFGDFYEGEFKNGFLHGEGVFTFNNGDYYKGYFKNGNYDGYGILHQDGDVFEGNWLEGELSGEGTHFYANGDFYEGNFRLGYYDGYGVLHEEGNIYEGYWEEGYKYGQGKIIMSDGRTLEGNFVKDELEGIFYIDGKAAQFEGEEWVYLDDVPDKESSENIPACLIENGNVVSDYTCSASIKFSEYEYSGTFLNRKMDGYGKLSFPETSEMYGQTYEGEFKNDLYHGQGTYSYPSGDSYVGNFRFDTFDGYGIFYYESGEDKGNKYEGYWKEGLEHGQGKYTFATGAIVEDEYVNGQIEGIFYLNGERVTYDGEEVIYLDDIPENSKQAQTNSQVSKPTSSTLGFDEALECFDNKRYSCAYDGFSLEYLNNNSFNGWTEYHLGKLYLDGKGTNKDVTKGTELWEEAYNKTSLGQIRWLTSTNLAWNYATEIGIRNKEKAKFWADLSLSDADSTTLNNYGVFLEEGYLLERDTSKAFEYYKMAAESEGQRNFPFSNLGRFYTLGKGNVRKSFDKALWYFDKAIEIGGEDATTAISYSRVINRYNRLPNSVSELSSWLEEDIIDFEQSNFLVLGWLHDDENIVEGLKWFLLQEKLGENIEDRDRARELIDRAKELINYDKELIKQIEGMAEDWKRTFWDNTGTEFSNQKNNNTPQETISSGSGFFINDEGYVVSNNHVVDECNQVKIIYNKKEFNTNLVDSNTDYDLSLLKIDDENKNFIIFSNNQIRLGQKVAASGFPLQFTDKPILNVTFGNISALIGLLDDSNHLQFTAPIQSGNSGGPLINEFGTLSGVIVSKLNDEIFLEYTGSIPQNVNFAIRKEILENFLNMNNVNYEKLNDENKYADEEIATIAEKSTVKILCKN